MRRISVRTLACCIGIITVMTACSSTTVPTAPSVRKEPVPVSAVPSTARERLPTQAPAVTSEAVPASPSPSPSPSIAASPSLEPSPSTEAAPTETPKATATVSVKPTAKPVPASPAAAEQKALSWYFVKKGAGKVPGFPAEVQPLKPGVKAVWVGSGKKVYLTFDTGGPMGDTEKLLQTLKDNGVKASFFIAGYNMKAHPDFLRRLAAEGHIVADHTMSHRDLTKLSDDEVRKEINDFASMYKEITGQEQPKYFRFPYGAYSLHLLDLVSEMGYTSVFWSTAMRDWEPRKNGAEDAYNDVMNMLHDGNIILMHQGSDDNINALDRIIKSIKEKGFTFSTIEDF